MHNEHNENVYMCCELYPKMVSVSNSYMLESEWKVGNMHKIFSFWKRKNDLVHPYTPNRLQEDCNSDMSSFQKQVAYFRCLCSPYYNKKIHRYINNVDFI